MKRKDIDYGSGQFVIKFFAIYSSIAAVLFLAGFLAVKKNFTLAARHNAGDLAIDLGAKPFYPTATRTINLDKKYFEGLETEKVKITDVSVKDGQVDISGRTKMGVVSPVFSLTVKPEVEDGSLRLTVIKSSYAGIYTGLLNRTADSMIKEYLDKFNAEFETRNIKYHENGIEVEVMSR